MASFFLKNNILLNKELLDGSRQLPCHCTFSTATRSSAGPADPTAGYLGFSRTLTRIQEKYYWATPYCRCRSLDEDMQGLPATLDTADKASGTSSVDRSTSLTLPADQDGLAGAISDVNVRHQMDRRSYGLPHLLRRKQGPAQR